VQPLPLTPAASQFPVSWTGSDQHSGVLDYTIFVSDDNGPFVPWLIRTTQTTGSYPGQPGHTYRFYSLARDGAGNLEAPPPAGSDTITALVPPAAPTGLDGQALSGDQIQLQWTDASTTETGFRVEGRTGANSFAPLASLPANATQAVVGSLTSNTDYEFRVVAVNAFGDSPPSNTKAIHTPGVTPPAAPGNPSGSDTNAVKTRVSWTDPRTWGRELPAALAAATSPRRG
jgi:hypothetical protein